MRLNSQDSQKTYLGRLRNVHTKFQFRSSIGKGEIREEQAQKNKKNRKKNYIFEAVRWSNESEKSKLLKGIFRTLSKSIYQMSTSQINLGEGR